jgi:capsular exopolysaccharide synthesis family protein
MASAFPPRNVHVIDPATRPLRPYLPNWLLNLTATSALGLSLGFVLAVRRERNPRTIQLPGEIAHLTGIPELGAIPPIEVRRSLAAHQNGDGYQSVKEIAGINETSHDFPQTQRSRFLGLLERQGRPSLFADSLRAVGTSILLELDGSGPRVYVVSSPVADEGKTTVAASLAIALAETGVRLLLIDGDLRRPRLHEIFGLENKVGLGELLDRPLEYPSTRVIQSTHIPRLWVMTSGSVRDNDLLYSPRFGEMLRTARARFALVLVDSPPMLVIPDARIMARHADGIILVARAEQTTSDSVRLAHQRLCQDGTSILGAVLNDVDAVASKYPEYRAYYGHYYRSLS